jgi:leader peptidase (prepilin peptidase)/N-methyltransferase
VSEAVAWVFLVVLGLVVGSFLTVVISRVPEGRSIVRPGSACDGCGAELTGADLVPVVSWIVLRGRCRHCGTSIGPMPVVVELLTAGSFTAMAWRLGWSWALPGFLVLVAALIALSFIDLATKRLPRKITYVAAALGVPWLMVAALVDDEPDRITTTFVGAGIALVAFLAVYLGARGGFGDGDVRLAPLLGAHLGWFDLWHVAIGLFMGFVIGAVVGVAMMAVGRAGRRTALPFGPFMAIGAVVVILMGDPIIDVWLQR